MSFKYDYIPLEKLNEQKPKSVILADGIANFFIDDVLEKNQDGSPRTTKDGIPKITFKMECTDSHMKQGIIYHDMSANMQWSFIALGKAINKEIYNESGTMHWKNLIGSKGKCILETKANPGYDARTNIKRYLPHEQAAVTELDDGMPF